ncbi:TrbI/VirB10 family protein [uncultured Photobacterium sp.]|uniref:TraB/VirB10 family protein n=1 Tax=uncultured Photobacterium sp. TaxID=173973 RepID=UPI002625E025|nr:TrbI/VirB10 family protein [uncultured Photobacterium sp.]
MNNLKDQFDELWGDRKKRIGVLMAAAAGFGIIAVPYIKPSMPVSTGKSDAIQKVFFPTDTDIVLERNELEHVTDAFKSISEMERRGQTQTKNIAMDSVLLELDDLRTKVESQEQELSQWVSGQKRFNQQRDPLYPKRQPTNQRQPTYQQTGGNAADNNVARPESTVSAPQQSPAPQPAGIRTINADNYIIALSNGQIQRLGDPLTLANVSGNQTADQEKIALDEKERELDNKLDALATTEETKGYSITLPSTSLLTGVLLSGMQAPTSIGSKREPLPATIRFKVDALLPNNYRVDLRDCQGHVSAIGSLSDSRTYMRLETIVCIDEEGLIAEASAKGYATGGDGQAGIPGILVTRNGDVLKGSLWAGLFSGLAEGIAPQRVVGIDVVGDDSGGYQVPDLGTMGASAALTGASSSLDRLSEYYVKMLEEIWPTVDVPAMQEVSFFLQAPLTLQFQ